VPLELALNLTPLLLDELLRQVFPGVERRQVFGNPQKKSTAPPEINLGIEELLHSYLPAGNDGLNRFTSLVLAKILAARAAHPGHLWVAMGLFERKELSAAIGRHLPALLAANHQGMRWKRFLFKQVCELNGGRMCKSPVCGDCSDYTFCFATEEE
jgi:nitrogen fixation protein NifQ